jgi:hypothetical protein
MTMLVPEASDDDSTVPCGFHWTANADETPTKAVSPRAATAKRPSDLILLMS